MSTQRAGFAVPEADIVAWRRQVHAHPELAYEEHRTAAMVEGLLASFGIQTWRPTPTSVVGDLAGTATGPRRRIALRADMDALPVQEETGLPFASTVPGVMHACGHDAHTAMLLGSACTLAGLRDRFAGSVRFVFQHAEEKNPGGAKFLVEAGVLDGVDAIFGFHMMNGPAGTIQATKGPATSSAGGFFLTVQGRGSHGSMPHLGIDPVLCAAQIVVALNHIVSRSTDPQHTVVVNAGMLQTGQAPNVVPDTARLGCSIRTFTPEDTEVCSRRAREVVAGICLAYGCTYDLDWVEPYDIVHNDPGLVDLALSAARAVVGPHRVSERGPTTGSEDFSAFTNVVPGAFVLVNGGDADDGLPFPNHHPKFDVREDTLVSGARLQVRLVLDLLGAGSAGPDTGAPA